MLKRLIHLTLALLLGLTLTATVRSADEHAAPVAHGTAGPLAKGDEIVIRVESTTAEGVTQAKTKIQDDGNIAVPFASIPVKAAGLTTVELEKAIKTAYEDQGVSSKGSIVVTHASDFHETVTAAANVESAAVTEHATAHEGEAAHGSEHEKLPGLLDAQFASMIWVLVIFIVLLAILYPTAWKSVLAGLKKREERIRKDIAEAEASRVRAEATLRDYNQQLAGAENRVREMLAKATADGERIATSLKMQAQQEAEEAKERATREIEAAKNQALTEIYQQTANLATSVAEKILRRNLNADDQRDLVNQSLEQLQSIGKN